MNEAAPGSPVQRQAAAINTPLWQAPASAATHVQPLGDGEHVDLVVVVRSNAADATADATETPP